MFRLRHLLPLAAIAAVLVYAAPAPAQTIIDEWASVKAPPPPALKPVTLDPKTTALLIIDIIKQTCNEQRRPRCVAAIPKVQKLLTEARAKGVYVIYALFPSPSPATFPNPKITDVVPELTPKGDEPVVTAFVDKNRYNIAQDVDGDPVFLARSSFDLKWSLDHNPDIRFTDIKETQRRAVA